MKRVKRGAGLKAKRSLLVITFSLLILVIVALMMLFSTGMIIGTHKPSLNRELVARLMPKALTGDGEACWCLYLAYLYVDEREADGWLQKGVGIGNPSALYRSYEDSMRLRPAEAKRNVELLIKAAQKDHADAQVRLADLYKEGRVVVRDAKKAEYWYRRAANGGDKWAMLKLSQYIAKIRPAVTGLTEAYAWTILALSRSGTNISFASDVKQQQLEIITLAVTAGHTKSTLIHKAELEARNQEEQLKLQPPAYLDKYLEDCKKLGNNRGT
jgi:TPR repeat protein